MDSTIDLQQDRCTTFGMCGARIAKNTLPGKRSERDVQSLMRLFKFGCSFFAGFSQSVLEEICQCVRYAAMPVRTVLFHEGDAPSYVYMIATGRVKLTTESGNAPNVRVSRLDMLEYGSELSPELDTAAPTNNGSRLKKNFSSLTSQQRLIFKGLREDAELKMKSLSSGTKFRAAAASLGGPSLKAMFQRPMINFNVCRTTPESPLSSVVVVEACSRSASPSSYADAHEEASAPPTAHSKSKQATGPLSAPLTDVIRSLAAERRHSPAAWEGRRQQKGALSGFGGAFKCFGKRVDVALKDKSRPDFKADSSSVGAVSNRKTRRRQSKFMDSSMDQLPNLPGVNLLNFDEADPTPIDSPNRPEETLHLDDTNPSSEVATSAAGKRITGRTFFQKCRTKTLVAQEMSSLAKETTQSTEMRPGHCVGVDACFNDVPCEATAMTTTPSELLVLSFDEFRACTEMERLRRRGDREDALFAAVPTLRAHDKDKIDRLADCFTSSCHRRGTVLCWEGGTRTPNAEDDRLLLIVEGQARVLREYSEQSRQDGEPAVGGRPLVQNVGLLIPGHVINGASQLLGITEPYTVIVETAVAVILSASHSELARLAGCGILESLRDAVRDLARWRDQRIAKIGSVLPLQQLRSDAVGDMPHCATVDKVRDWLLESRNRPVPPPDSGPGVLASSQGKLVHSSITLPPSNSWYPSATERLDTEDVDASPNSIRRKQVLRGGLGPWTKPKAATRRLTTNGERIRELHLFDSDGNPYVQAMTSLSVRDRIRGDTGSAVALGVPPGDDSKQSQVTKTHEPSVADSIWLPSSPPGSGRGANSLDDAALYPHDLDGGLEGFWASSPELAGCVSQLRASEEVRSLTTSQRLERLEVRGDKALVVEVGPIDPLLITTASSAEDLELTSSTACTPLSGGTPSTRRRRQRACGPVATRVLQKRGYIAEVPNSTGTCRPDEPRRLISPNNALASAQQTADAVLLQDGSVEEVRVGDETESGRSRGLPVVALPGITAMQARPDTVDGEGDLPCSHSFSLLEDSLDDIRSVPGEISVEAGGDLLAGASLGNVSTMVDENSLWEMMGSILGSGPGDSVFLPSQSMSESNVGGQVGPLAHVSSPERLAGTTASTWDHCTMAVPLTEPIPQPKTAPLSQREGGHFRRSRNWPTRRRCSALSPDEGQQAICAATPLHVHSIDKFLAKSARSSRTS